jgi:hypothetical protein
VATSNKYFFGFKKHLLYFLPCHTHLVIVSTELDPVLTF